MKDMERAARLLPPTNAAKSAMRGNSVVRLCLPTPEDSPLSQSPNRDMEGKDDDEKLIISAQNQASEEMEVKMKAAAMTRTILMNPLLPFRQKIRANNEHVRSLKGQPASPILQF